MRVANERAASSKWIARQALHTADRIRDHDTMPARRKERESREAAASVSALVDATTPSKLVKVKPA